VAGEGRNRLPRRQEVDSLTGDRFTLKSKAGETVVLGPEGEGFPKESRPFEDEGKEMNMRHLNRRRFLAGIAAAPRQQPFHPWRW